MKETYYKKIPISSGEVPEDREQVTVGYTNGIETYEVSAEYFSTAKCWWSCIRTEKLINVLYWLKPVPSPKQEGLPEC